MSLAIDLDDVRTRLSTIESRGSIPMAIARTVNLYEQEMEVHRGAKSEFTSMEQFLAQSIWSMSGVASLGDALSELVDPERREPVNRAPHSGEIEDMYAPFAPVAWSMPPIASLRSTVVMFNGWNCKWLVMETNDAEFVSARWYTDA